MVFIFWPMVAPGFLSPVFGGAAAAGVLHHRLQLLRLDRDHVTLVRVEVLVRVLGR